MMTMRTGAAITLVYEERKRQDEKWGVVTKAPHEWMALLMEEVQSAAWAMTDDLEDYQIEVVQVAALAVSILESLMFGAAGMDLNDTSTALQKGLSA